MSQVIIDKKAKVHKSVCIGSYSIVEGDVEIGADCIIGSSVIIKRGTIIGRKNKISAGVQIGVDPLDYHFRGEVSQCIIGDGNIIREFTTISKATGKNMKTIIGHNNFIMTYVHIAHNMRIGNKTIISSGAQLGGYVQIDDFANIGGLAGIHQFCRVGKYAMVGAHSYLNKDVPPYLLARGDRAKVYGVNVRGLQHHSFSQEDIEYIKDLFRILYKTTRTISECLEMIKAKKHINQYDREMIQFFETSKRGILLKTS